MKIPKEDIKAFSLRVPKKLWLSLKKQSANLEMSMTDLIIESIIEHRKELKKRLTEDDIKV